MALIAIFAVRYNVESVTARSDTRVQLIEPARVPLRKHATIRAQRTPKIHARLLLPAFLPVLIDPLQPPVMQALPPMPAIVAEVSPTPEPVAPPAPAVQTGAFSRVKTGGFDNVSTASDPITPAKQVSTAGFGDATIAAAAVARRPVSYSGFGNAGATSAPEGYRGPVRNSGFGDAASVTPTAAAAHPLSPQPAIAAQILEKPHPIYTDEARRLQIEGEVQLEVLFGASGEIHVLRVIRGLGHGLDENAAHAARGIRFLPAKRDGRAVGSTALVHITFQLAS
jgi:TonB family protein